MSIREEDVFTDKQIAHQLVEAGVVKIPFLTPQEVELLNRLYNEKNPNDQLPIMYDGIHMSIWHSDLDYKTTIRDGIRQITEQAFKRNFKNYRTLTEQFIVKKRGEETTFHVHQDWAIVDEEKYFSLNMWIPLHDVDENNGAMWIVKGSHKIDYKVRGAGILFPNYTIFMEDLEPYITSYPMKAGEALVFYHRTLHGSPYNKTSPWRKVVQVSLLPANAPLQIYFQKDPDSPLEIHNPEDEFNLHYQEIRVESCLRPPTTKAHQLIAHYTPPPIEKETLLATIQHYKTPQGL